MRRSRSCGRTLRIQGAAGGGPAFREAKAHLILPGSWNLKVGRKGTTLCGLRIPESDSLLRTRDKIGICPECEVALARGGHWAKL